eukprot:gnl/MRDRNA2_/MRDRNA2_93442_c0_seq1.p1 gnl/MRDRNA2_/MRDRNA2_93442_c0~~gnl/MRDRNA2_/MRDRNA2_93442_c0_seq1.p1  ORF type:complete len:225 (+),score=52.84 gnl/MRDRNA2_/MRDRNA2_93442_c0_seq1:190-864(+)
MVSAKVQLANSATSNFKFDANVAEFFPAGDLNANAKEFKHSRPAVRSLPVQAINLDSYSSDDETPRDDQRPTCKKMPPAECKGLNLEAPEFVPCFNLEAKEFVPPTTKACKPAGAIRPPPGLEQKLGLSVHAKEFVPPAAAPVWQCAVNLDDYTDDEFEEEEKINISEWRGLCGRLASPYIWSEDKEDFMDEPALSDSEAETAEPSPNSSPNSDTEGCSGCESP